MQIKIVFQIFHNIRTKNHNVINLNVKSSVNSWFLLFSNEEQENVVHQSKSKRFTKFNEKPQCEEKLRY